MKLAKRDKDKPVKAINLKTKEYFESSLGKEVGNTSGVVEMEMRYQCEPFVVSSILHSSFPHKNLCF